RGLEGGGLRASACPPAGASRAHYVACTAPKKSGGPRPPSAPPPPRAPAQRWAPENVAGSPPAEPAAHGFLPFRSIVTNATPHVGKAVVVNLDLQDFFPSITFPRVRSVFHRAGYSPAVATVLALLCTECPRRHVEYDGKVYHV